MLLSAQEMKAYSFTILCRQIRELRAFIRFLNEFYDRPRNQKENAFMVWFNEDKINQALDEDDDFFEKQLSSLIVRAKNIRKEIAFSKE